MTAESFGAVPEPDKAGASDRGDHAGRAAAGRTSRSWLNMVAIFWIITRQAIRGGTYRSVHELTGAIRRFIDAYNERAQPFTWT